MYKNIVTIGATSGFWAANALKKKLPKDYRIILVDKQEALFYPIAALRAAVVSGWEERVHTSFANVFGKDSRHLALPGTTVTALKDRSVVVDRVHDQLGLGMEIPYEYCIIATGASQAPPARPAGRTAEEITSYLRACQAAIGASERVLVVGGGAAGLEFACEVRERHSNVAVTLVHRSDRLMRYAPHVHDKVLPILEKLGVEVIFEDTVIWPEGYHPGEPVPKVTVFRTQKGREIEAQFVYQATGNVPNSSLVAALDPAAISSNGCIRVKPILQVDSDHPWLQHTFAMGDVADIPGEIKLLGASERHGKTIAQNILSLIAGMPATKAHTPRMPGSTLILGTRNAVAYFPWFALSGSWLAAIGPKDLHADAWRKAWSGGKV